MALLIYDYPSDKQTGTWAKVGGTVDASFPLTNIDTDRVDKPLRFTANPTRLTLDMTSATRVDMVAFIHCNFDAGAVIKVQMNATDVWTGPPTVNGTLTHSAATEDGQPVNCYIDLTAVSGYSTGGFRYLSIEITSGQSTLLSFGLVRVSGRKRQPERNIQHDVKTRERHPVSGEFETYGAVTLGGYGFGVRRRSIGGSFRGLTATRFATLLSWWRAAYGRLKPFLLILDTEPHWVKWGPGSEAVFESQFTVLRQTVDVTFEEVGRGTAP